MKTGKGVFITSFMTWQIFTGNDYVARNTEGFEGVKWSKIHDLEAPTVWMRQMCLLVTEQYRNVKMMSSYKHYRTWRSNGPGFSELKRAV